MTTPAGDRRIGTVWMPGDLLPDVELRARCVAGDSMTGDHICDGDFIIIAVGAEAADGEIAAVMFTDPEGRQVRVVKHVRRDGGNLVLESSNPAYPPVIITQDAGPVVEGVVVSVMRHLE